MKKLIVLLIVLLACTSATLATDVTISATTITQLPFNPTNIGSDRTFTVTVTNGSSTVTSSAAFPSNIVGIGGFQILIGSTQYVVSGVASTSSLTLTTNYSGSTGSATMTLYKYTLFRGYATAGFQDTNGQNIQPGTPGSGNFYRQVAVSVINSGSNNIAYMPAFVMPSTTDAVTNNQARFVFAWYRTDGSLLAYYVCGSVQQLALQPNTPTTWTAICNYNAPGGVVPPNTETYTKAQIDQRFASCSQGQSYYFAANGNIVSCLNFGSGLTLTGNTLSAPGGGGSTSIVQAYNAKLDGGCAGDGVTNDTTCLNNALAAANAAGRQLFLPAGTYLANVTLAGLNSQRIFGEGPGRTLIQSATGASPTFFANNATGLTHSLTIEELSLVGFGSGAADYAFRMSPDQPFGLTMRNVRITNASDGGVYIPTNAFTMLFDGVDITVTGGNGFDIFGDNTVTLMRTYVHAVGTGGAAYRLRSGRFTLIGANGIDSGTNADWGVFGDTLAEDGQDAYARVALIGSNVEAFTNRGIRVKTGSQLDVRDTNFVSPPSGAVYGIVIDNMSGINPGVFDGLSGFTLVGTASWQNGVPITSGGVPFLFEGVPSVTTYYDTNEAALVNIGYRYTALNGSADRSTQWFNRIALGTSAGQGFDGNLSFIDDNTRTIGLSASSGRPSDIYVGTGGVHVGTGAATVDGQNWTITGGTNPLINFDNGSIAGRYQLLAGSYMQFGTTSAHDLAFLSNGTVTWRLDSAGSLWVDSGNRDIGKVAGNRPRTIYAGTSFDVGLSGTTTGALTFRNSTNSNTISFQAGATASNLVFTLPTTDSTGTQCLSSNGSATLGWSACSGGGGTPGGSNTQVQYNAAGSFGGISGFTSDGTNVTAGSGNLRATSPRFTTGINDSNGNELILVTATGSAVNEITLANAATGNNPTITASGDDANVGINFVPKGSGTIQVSGVPIVTTTATQTLTNKTLTAPVIATISNTGTLTLPTSTDTLVGRATTDTLTNKTLTASSNVLGGVTMTLGSDANGDIYYRASNVLTRLAIGTAAQCLKVNGGATAPEWGACGSGTITGSGTTGTIAKFTSSSAIGDSILTESSTTLTTAGRQTINGLTVSTDANNTVASLTANSTFTKNNSNGRDFFGVLIKPTFNFGGSNANTTVNVLQVDSTNTSLTGGTFNLLHLKFGGSTVFNVDSAGAITFANGVRQAFAPDTVNASLNVGQVGADPSSPVNGDIVYETNTNKFRCYENSAWVNCVGSGSGTVTSVALAAGTSGTDVNISGSPVTTSGTITLNIPDASASARGLITTGTQTIAGAKTFTGAHAIQATTTAREIDPETDNTYDLGTTSLRWKTVHVGPGSVVVHNDNTNTLKATLGFSGSTAQLVTDSATPLQLATGSNNGLFLRTDGTIGFNLTGATSGNIDLRQLTNGNTILYARRATDTSPTGNFLQFQNAAAADVWAVDITGSLTAGTIPAARVSSGTISATNGGTGQNFSSSTGSIRVASGTFSANTETGTGNSVLATSPTLVTPNLGTPSAVTLTNGTGLPISTGVSGLGTGVATFLATPSSANLAAAVTDETGSGSLVFGTSPTLTTPNIGAATATSINGLTITSSTGTLTVANGKTATISNSITFAGTDSTTMTFPGTSDTIAGLAQGQTFTAQQTITGGTSSGADRLLMTVTALATNGVRTSPNIIWRGSSYDGTAHTVDWRARGVPTTNAGVSQWDLQSRIDGNSFATRLSVADDGTLTIGGGMLAGSGSVAVIDSTGNLQVSGFAAASLSGNGGKLATTTGTLTSGRCVEIDANGNFVQASGACGIAGAGYTTIQEEGSNLTARTTLNFVGSSATAADDAGNSRTNVTFDSDLNALASNSTTGLWTITGSGSGAARTITGTSGTISVTNGDGVSGNPTLTIDAAYVGQTSITTLGTITTGTWNGTTIAVARGGTGATTLTGILKGNGTSAFTAAVAGTDYVAPGAVTTSGLTMATARILGRSTASTGAIEEITVGSGLSLSGGTLSATGGTGTVTSFSAGNLSPLFTTSVSTATTTPSLSFSLSNAAANTYFGNATGSTAAPSFTAAGALTKTDDTNVTLTLGGSPTVALLNAASITVGWTGTLAAGRLNSNVVQAVSNDTNITGSISSQTLTLGFTGTLAKARQNAATVYNDAANTWSTGAQDFGSATSLKLPTSAGAAPTANGLVAYDSTANAYKFGVSGATKTVLMTDGDGGSLTNLNASNLASGTVPLARLSGITTTQLSGSAGITNAQLANSAVTIGSTSVSLGGTAATVAGLTLTTPTIASFTNATHDHTNAAGGGQLALSAFSSTTGSGNVVGATSPTITNATINQAANNADALTSIRFTDSSPTGNFLRFRNAANNTDLFAVSVAGTITAGTWNGAVIGSAYGGAGTVNGILKANGSGTVSAAVSGTDYAPATSGSSILYGNGSGGFSNVTVGSGLSFSSGTLSATGAAPAWSSITNPSGAGLSLSMAAFATTFTWNATTSTTNLFNLTDTTGNTGTGYVLTTATASGSAAKPFRFTAGGTSNGVEMDTNGVIAALGTGGIDPAALVTTAGFIPDGALSINVPLLDSINTFTNPQTFSVNDSATNAVTNLFDIQHSSTGSTTTNFGTGLRFGLESGNGTTNRDAARLNVQWSTATDASRTAKMVVQLVNGGAALADKATFDGNGNLTVTGVYIAGSAPTTLTDSTGKILSAALNTVGVAQGGTGATTLTGILKGNGTSAFTAATAGTDYTSPSSTETFTNKTYDAEGTGNVLSIPVKSVFVAAGCNNTTAGTALDLPTSGGASAACLGTTTTQGVLEFADGSTQSATGHLTLPSDWTSTGGVDVRLLYTGSTSSTNNIRWQVSCGCVADSDDIVAPSYNTATASSGAGPTTAGQRKTLTFTGISVTNCAASETLYLKVERIGGDGADTYTGIGRLVEFEVTYRRAM